MPELIDLITTNFDYDNFFSAKLTAPMTASDTDVFLDAIPTPSEGVLVIDWDVADSREIIFYNSKTASKVTCPSVANGRGFDDTTATTHLSGANVIMAPVRAWFRLAQQLATTSEQGWKPLGYTPNTIVDNGNRQYTMVFNSVDLTSFLSPGMRLKGTPTTAKPTQCADLESSSSQYFNKTTPGGLTFTDDFVAGGWVKPESYAAMTIISRYNGTSGWELQLNSTGQVIIVGYNGGAGNNSQAYSYQTLPLSRWTHVAAQLDMSAFTATSTTSYIMLDGVSVLAAVARVGTNPTALVQAGNLEVGSRNGGTNLFDGKLAQVFVSSAKITQANVLLLKNQGITTSDCSTYSIASAFSLSGASGLTDINTTNTNNLTAQGGALTTNNDSPFGVNAFGVPGTNEWGIVTSATYSTNTTITVQAPEGSTWPTLPTSSAISSMEYSGIDAPYGMPKAPSKWEIRSIIKQRQTVAGGAAYSFVNMNSAIVVPVGDWELGYTVDCIITHAGTTNLSLYSTLSTTNNGQTDNELTSTANLSQPSSAQSSGFVTKYKNMSLNSQTTYYFNMAPNTTSATLYAGDASGLNAVSYLNASFGLL